jgi:hypothetical protein
MREGKKHPKLKLDTNGINNDYSYLKSSSFFSSNNKTRNKPHNLILSYYNKDDPYIQMFENIINTKAKNNNIKVMKEADINELNQKRNFNPILESFKDNFSEKLDLKKINEQEEIKTKEKPKEKIEETIPQKDIEKNITKTVSSDNNNNIKINENKEIRPKTGFKSVATGVNNWFKRPLTSIFKRYDISWVVSHPYFCVTKTVNSWNLSCNFEISLGPKESVLISGYQLTMELIKLERLSPSISSKIL